MKTVFTNDQIMHVYAQQNQDRGKTNNGNIFFEKNVIYSYGYHFPLCVIIGETAFINDQSYSVSTSQHQSKLRYAVNHYKSLYVDTQTLKAISELSNQLSNKYFNAKDKLRSKNLLRDKVTDNALNDMQSHIHNASKRRKEELKVNDIKNALNTLENAVKVISFFKIKPPHKLTSRIKNISENADKILAMHAEHEKQKKIKAEKAKIARDKKLEIDVNLWLNGADLIEHDVQYVPSLTSQARQYSKVLMRVNGDNIQTSQGASFPIEHAKKAFIFIRYLKDNNKSWDRKDMGSPIATNQAFRLGHFTIDTIDKQGNVKAGCHYVEWDAIETVARKLEIYP